MTTFAVTNQENRVMLAKRIQELMGIEWFRKSKRVAHGITEAFTNKEDATFKAGMGATKAAISLSQSNSFEQAGINLFFPIVVLEGDLYECYLKDDGTSIIEKIDSSFLNFQVRFGEFFGASIHIVTLEPFEKYCQETKDTFTSLKKILKAERIEQAIQNHIDPNLINDL